MLAEPTVVIVTHCGDIHAERVSAIIARRGAAVFRIDIDCFPRDYRLSLMLGESGWQGEISCNRTNTTLDVAALRSVWMRKPAAFAFASDLSPQEKAFADGEANHLLLGWLNSLDCFFMSHPVALRAAGWKCEQLVRARRFGFEVPASALTNLPDRARSFIADAPGGAIYKTLSTPMLAADQVSDADRVAEVLHTSMIVADDADLDSVALLPGLFQHYVDKAYEVRATVVAGKIFAARIDSQADPRTRVDFRHHDVEVDYRAIDLPDPVAERCRDFVASYGLSYGAIDLIAKPDGSYVFLENNPVGQFIFVEELAPELAITAAVADALIAGGGQ